VITCGGVGGLVDPTLFRTSDITLSVGDNLMKQVRKKLRQKYGYPSVYEIDSENEKMPEHKRSRNTWSIPCVHTLPIGYCRSTPVCSTATADTILSGNDESVNGFRKCDTQFGNACFATGTAGFIMASIATTMIATDCYTVPNVNVNDTPRAIANRNEIAGN